MVAPAQDSTSTPTGISRSTFITGPASSKLSRLQGPRPPVTPLRVAVTVATATGAVPELVKVPLKGWGGPPIEHGRDGSLVDDQGGGHLLNRHLAVPSRSRRVDRDTATTTGSEENQRAESHQDDQQQDPALTGPPGRRELDGGPEVGHCRAVRVTGMWNRAP